MELPTAASPQVAELPPLPNHFIFDSRYGMSHEPAFTAAQMREYARAALASIPSSAGKAGSTQRVESSGEAKLPTADTPTPLSTLDEQYRKALSLVFDAGRASVSMVQRKLCIRYSEAQELVARMVRDGYVGFGDTPGLRASGEGAHKTLRSNHDR
jgi:DNA segregation ATPase FtsK/SpoIIIE-like protein